MRRSNVVSSTVYKYPMAQTERGDGEEGGMQSENLKMILPTRQRQTMRQGRGCMRLAVQVVADAVFGEGVQTEALAGPNLQAAVASVCDEGGHDRPCGEDKAARE